MLHSTPMTTILLPLKLITLVYQPVIPVVSLYIVIYTCMPFIFRCFFWLVVREKRVQHQTILLAQMQLTSQEVEKVLSES